MSTLQHFSRMTQRSGLHALGILLVVQAQCTAAEVIQKLLRQSALDQVEGKASANEPEYTRVFGELGMKPAEVETVLARLKELHWKAIAAERPMQGLAMERFKYDQEIRTILDETNYAKYVVFERSKSARREYEGLSAFALQSNNFAMDSVYYERIVQLIMDAKATTTESWDGPYDPMPHPEVKDSQGAISDLIRVLIELRQKATTVAELLSKRDFPSEYRRAIEGYYSWKIKEVNERIAWFSLSPDEQSKRSMQERNPKTTVSPGELR